jgi:hypothetical protein
MRLLFLPRSRSNLCLRWLGSRNSVYLIRCGCSGWRRGWKKVHLLSRVVVPQGVYCASLRFVTGLFTAVLAPAMRPRWRDPVLVSGVDPVVDLDLLPSVAAAPVVDPVVEVVEDPVVADVALSPLAWEVRAAGFLGCVSRLAAVAAFLELNGFSRLGQLSRMRDPQTWDGAVDLDACELSFVGGLRSLPPVSCPRSARCIVICLESVLLICLCLQDCACRSHRAVARW